MAGRGPRSAIERAEIGNSRPTVVRACALLDPFASELHAQKENLIEVETSAYRRISTIYKL